MQTFERQLSVPALSLTDRLLSWAIAKLTSRHGRRIIVLTSLYFQVVRIEKMRDDVVRSLNAMMSLARSERALQLPIAIKGIVWRATDLNGILTEADFTGPVTQERAITISRKVVDRVPRCLRYGDDDAMINDVFNLIRNGQVLSRAAA